MQNTWQDELVKKQGPLFKAKIQDIAIINSGSIVKTSRLELNDGRQFFAKTTDINHFEMLEFESEGLIALNKFSNKSFINIPEVLGLYRLGDSSILLTPWLKFGYGSQKKLGQGLAKIHQASTKNNPGQFGWSKNGFIGLGHQTKGWLDNWGKCFVELRLWPQLIKASNQGINIATYTKTFEKLVHFLNEHKPQPSLVHGDLWSGNVGVNEKGEGVIFDPASWWADREVDIAMTKLFGGFNNDFYDGYESTWPLPKNAKERIDIYNLYHIINHANIFGGSYINESIQKLENIRLKLNA